jgi:LysR family hydrogen peroxide-inducible transcriptional activator
VLPTPEGRAVDAIGRRVLDGVREIGDRGAGMLGDTAHPVVVDLGASVSVGPYLLPRAIGRLRAAAPGLRINVREGSTDRLAEELRSGVHDLVLTQLPIPVGGVSWIEVGTERLVILLAAEHPLARHDRITPQMLAGQSFVTLGPGFVLTRMTERIAADCGATVLRGYEGNSMDALRLICAMGEGIALVPELYARSEVRAAEGVVFRPVARQRLERSLVVAWRSSLAEPPIARLVAGCLRETLAESLGPEGA